MPSTPFSSALSRANPRARSEMSVATTRRAQRRACRAWMPHPVPRSSTESTGSGSCSPLSVTDAPPTPSTWSSAELASGGELAEVARDPPLAGAAGVEERRTAAGRRAAGRPRPSIASSARSTAPGTPSAGSAASACDARRPTRRARRAARAWPPGRRLPGEGAFGRNPVAAPEGRLGGTPPQRVEPVDGEAGRGEVGAQPRDQLAVGGHARSGSSGRLGDLGSLVDRCRCRAGSMSSGCSSSSRGIRAMRIAATAMHGRNRAGEQEGPAVADRLADRSGDRHRDRHEGERDEEVEARHATEHRRRNPALQQRAPDHRAGAVAEADEEHRDREHPEFDS